MADEEEDQEPVEKDPRDPYHKYPLKPTFWQRAKERIFEPDKNAQLEIIRRRRLRIRGEDE